MKRILIVDDEVAILSAFKKILKSDFVQLDTAETIEDAEKLFKTQKYDVVITDLRLTGIIGEEGLEILNYIKGFIPDTKVIIITGYGTPEIMAKSYKMGADYYFEKPIDPEMIKGALKSLGVEL